MSLSPEQIEVVEYALSSEGGTIQAFADGYPLGARRSRKAAKELIERAAKNLGLDVPARDAFEAIRKLAVKTLAKGYAQNIVELNARHEAAEKALREAAQYFIGNFSGYKPRIGDKLERVTMIDCGLRLSRALIAHEVPKEEV